MSDDDLGIVDFGFDDVGVVKVTGVDKFKQSRPNQVDRISVIAFKTFADVVIAAKTREKGERLDDNEKTELITKIDSRLAESLSKKVEELTEIDRLDIKHPRFSVSWTHYEDNVGTIRCLSKRNGPNIIEEALCCKKMDEASQRVCTLILRYPVDNDYQVDGELLKMRKYTHIETYRLSAKKFKKVEGVYKDSRNNSMPVIDLKITLDGDPQYQKQQIETGMTAFWAREDTDPEIRHWVLSEGLKKYKYVKSELGFQMKADKLAEKLGMGAQLPAGAASAAAPAITASYKDLLS
ncbi:MAG: hypothetical protein ACWGQW_11135 [bacterium]